MWFLIVSSLAERARANKNTPPWFCQGSRLSLLLLWQSPFLRLIKTTQSKSISEEQQCLHCNRTSVLCSRKTVFLRHHLVSAPAPISKAAKITTESTNVRLKTPKASGQRSPASFT